MQEQNKAIVTRVFEELWRPDSTLKTIEELVSPDHVFHFHDLINPDPGVGVEGYKKVLQGFATAFPDYTVKMEQPIIAEGDWLLNPWLFEGTNLGKLGTIAPTGKKASVPGIDITHVVDGKVTETHVYGDNLGMMLQLDAVTLPAVDNS